MAHRARMILDALPGVSRQMTDPSWQFRSGKEQQIHAVAGTARDEIPWVRILTSRLISREPSPSTHRAIGEPPLSVVQLLHPRRTGKHFRFQVDDQMELSQRSQLRQDQCCPVKDGLGQVTSDFGMNLTGFMLPVQKSCRITIKELVHMIVPPSRDFVQSESSSIRPIRSSSNSSRSSSKSSSNSSSNSSCPDMGSMK